MDPHISFLTICSHSPMFRSESGTDKTGIEHFRMHFNVGNQLFERFYAYGSDRLCRSRAQKNLVSLKSTWSKVPATPIGSIER